MNAQKTDFEDFLEKAISTAKKARPDSCIDNTYSCVGKKIDECCKRDALEYKRILGFSLIAILLILLVNISFTFFHEDSLINDDTQIELITESDEVSETPLFYIDNYLATLYEY
ncbi:hypothetical protein LJC16_02050 [Bacteroidales bacterium OttesenSCG-928-C19]|nr:hypothetical protein [Bacteroidales bacterium OttesenSCG-928-C19]